MKKEDAIGALGELVHHVKKLPREWWGPVPALVRRIERAEEVLRGEEMREVWLLCWCEWDYDFHEDPVEAYSTEAAAMEAAKSKKEGMYNGHGHSREGWSVKAVDWMGT